MKRGKPTHWLEDLDVGWPGEILVDLMIRERPEEWIYTNNKVQ